MSQFQPYEPMALFDPEAGIVSTHGHQAAETRSITAKRSVVAVFPDIPIAEGGEGGGRPSRHHAGNGMQVLDGASPTRRALITT
jgi:hypothetical protein